MSSSGAGDPQIGSLEYCSRAYQRLARHLLEPTRMYDKANVDEFTQRGCLHIRDVGASLDPQRLKELEVRDSVVVPAFPLAVYAAKYNSRDKIFARRDCDSQGSEAQIERDNSAWQELAKVPRRAGVPTAVAAPRGIPLRMKADETSRYLGTIMKHYLAAGCSWTSTAGNYREHWRQLALNTELVDEEITEGDQARVKLSRGMPSSPDVTYFRLEVTEVSTGRLAASVLFLCVLVSDSGSLGKRPWESTDRITGCVNSVLATSSHPTSEEYLAGAYQRLVRHLLDPIKHQPNVTEFMDLGCLQIAATTEPAQVLDALDVSASLIVPAFPLPVFPMRMELERLPHLFARKDNRTSDKEKPKDKEAKDVPWKALAEKHYNKGVPAVVAAPRGLTLRSRVEGEPGENRIMMTYTEQDCCWLVTHGDYEESWRQLSLKSELTNQGYAADRHRRDELKRGMPASPYVTHFRLEVEKKSTGERATSAVFRCYIVPDTVQPGYRSWTEADGIPRHEHSLSYLIPFASYDLRLRRGHPIPMRYYAEAYRRLVRYLCEPIRKQQNVEEFIEFGSQRITAVHESPETRLAFDINSSFVVPAFPLAVFPERINGYIKPPIHLVARRDRLGSVSPAEIAAQEQVWAQLEPAPSKRGPAVVAAPRGIHFRVAVDQNENETANDMSVYMRENFSCKMIYGEIEESWRQLWLKLPADTREDLGETRARSELRRGMPSSPNVTVFRLEVKESSNQQRLASATFRCCIVPGNGPHGRRQWTLEDGIPELSSLEDIVEPPRVAKTGLSHSHALSHRQRKIYGQDFVVAGSRRF